MNQFTTNISYFDQIIQNLNKEEIYLVRTNYNRLSHLFFHNFLVSHLKQNTKVLFLTSTNPEKIIEDTQFLDFNVKPYLENQNLVILEEPAELDIILSNLNNLEAVLEDLSTYIDTYKPDFILIDSILSFLTKNNQTNNKIFINRFINFLKEKKAVSFIECSNLDYELQNYIEKDIYASFSFKYNAETLIHLLSYNTIKSNEQHEIIFSLESSKYFCVPHLNNSLNSTINEIETIYLQNSVKSIEEALKKYTSKKVKFVCFNDYQEIIHQLKDDTRELIIFPTYLEMVNGVDLAIKIRNNFINTKIVVIGSRNTTPNHKARIIRYGVNKFLAYPYEEKDIKSMLDYLYPQKIDKNNRYNIKLLYKDNIPLVHELNESIYFEAINRIIKEYAQNVILSASNLSFFKLNINDLNYFVYLQILTQYQGLVAVFSNHISPQETHIIAIYRDIKTNIKNKILTQINHLFGNANNNNKLNNSNFLKTIFSPEDFKYQVSTLMDDNHKPISCIVYPYENTNIDNLLSSLFEYVR